MPTFLAVLFVQPQRSLIQIRPVDIQEQVADAGPHALSLKSKYFHIKLQFHMKGREATLLSLSEGGLIWAVEGTASLEVPEGARNLMTVALKWRERSNWMTRQWITASSALNVGLLPGCWIPQSILTCWPDTISKQRTVPILRWAHYLSVISHSLQAPSVPSCLSDQQMQLLTQNGI